MKKIVAIILTAALVFTAFDCVFADEEFRLSLDGEWDFCYYPSSEDAGEEGRITVPGAIELQGYGYPGYYFEEQLYWGAPQDDGIHSIGVYSKSFSADAARKAFLVFDSVKDELEVYFNDEKIGESSNAEAGSVFEVSLKKGENSVKAIVTRDNGGINKADNFALSGIVGSVYLTEKSPYGEAESRDIRIEGNSLYIDGERTVLRGVKYTPTYPTGGDVISAEQIEKDLSLIKEYGFNAVWTVSAPEFFYEKAEEKGLYVIDEANVYLQGSGGNPGMGGEDTREEDGDAVLRVEETVKRHRKYKSVIMWSIGSGDGADPSLISAAERYDARPVVQKVNALADTFEVFGNTGGFEDWVSSLGNGNIGGFIREFADKELYWTRNVYEFDVSDKATGVKTDIDGEIKYIGGKPYLGEAEFKNEVKELDRFTVLAYVSDPNGDRVIFESEDKAVRLEVKQNRAFMTIGGQSADASFSEGRIGIIYADGEAQLFTGNSFKANFRCGAHIGGSFSVGAGDGGTGIGYIKIYDDALTLDELLTEQTEAETVSDISFSDINIKKDKSYQFLAYGGDFGDTVNSYYKSVKGLFSSLREPHPEAEEVKAIFAGETCGAPDVSLKKSESAKAIAEITGGKAYLTSKSTTAVINSDGAIESFVYNGREQLSEPLSPAAAREVTLSEYESGAYPEERRFNTKSFEVEENIVYAELVNGDGRLNISYYLTEDGELNVSMRSQFGENAEKPTFIGFEGKTEYTRAAWYGKGLASTYPDRRNAGEYGEFEADIKELSDNYAVPQENGNRLAYVYTLSGENGHLTFASAEGLEITALPYPPENAEYESHDEDMEFDDASYIRLGGYIAGVSGKEEYKLNKSSYGFSFVMTCGEAALPEDVSAVYADGERFTDFAPGIKTYVYRTNSVPEISVNGGAEVIYHGSYCTFGEYTVYFAPADEYLSDIAEEAAEGEISKDAYFGTEVITLRGERFRGESDKAYQKGIAMKAGSEIVYDVSAFDNNVFTAVIGKDASDMSMGMGFDRRRFDAEADVKVYLDGSLAAEVNGVSMFSGRSGIRIDVSDAKELKIAVTARDEQSAQNADAVLADAKIAPKGPITLDFSRSGREASITVLNTDSDEVDVLLSATDGAEVKSVGTTITRGLYRTLTLPDIAENAEIEAVISGCGKIKLTE